ncbi:hypothetical protein BT63DRAFT_385205 [Microthyrium microscopicum]|uniref:DNA polymerase V n=1 Tax=Microthyrium microscopicum TaxID=703497 RepID=A0A6A6UF46_9PEZI|nr:hypothetical protein BT63DRAFT_385205 [Microthyrium microscopicum]
MAKSLTENANNVELGRKRLRDTSNETPESPSSIPVRKRQFTEQDQAFARIYDELADESSDVRLQAAKDFLQELAPEKNPSAQTIEKVITRLIRGLCSGRKAARYGFFVALTELLRQLYGPKSQHAILNMMTLEELVPLIVKSTRPEGKVAGQEKRDHHFGRLYACKSMIESSILRQAKSMELLDQVLEIVFNLAKSVSWIREECGMVIVEAIKTASQEKDSAKFIQICVEKLASGAILKTPEGVAIWLTAQTTKGNSTLKFPASAWIHDDPLHADNRSQLLKAMRDQIDTKQPVDSENGKAKSGHWQQSVNFSWEVVLARAIEVSDPEDTDSPKEAEANKFRSIWTGLVDNGLMTEKSSQERRFWGFQLFTKMIKTAPEWTIRFLFQPSFLYHTINNQSSEDKTLHEAAADALRKLKSRVKNSPDIADKVVAGLMTKPGSIFFDKLTKTKTLEEIIVAASPKSFAKIVDLFDGFIQKQRSKDQKAAENARQALADLLLASYRGRVKEAIDDPQSKSSIKPVLSLYLKHAYCKLRDEGAESATPRPEISASSRKMFHSRLSSCLAFTLSETKNPSKWPWFVVHQLHNITKSNKDHQLILDAEKEVHKTIKEAYNKAKALSSISPTEEKEIPNQAILLLFSLTLIQAYSGEPDAIAVLQELNEAFPEEEVSNERKYDQVLEILLSFLSKPSALFRTMATQVFSSITSYITEDGLDSLITILRQPETLAGQQELFAEQDDRSDGDDSEDELDSDVEMVDATGGAESSEDSDDDSEEDNDDDSPDEELQDFELKLAEALKTSRADALLNGNEDSDGASMDDEEMLEIEPKLTAVFRERRLKASKQKERKNAKENVINFKRRVLDLLSIYMKKEASNSTSLVLIVPLLELLRTSNDKSLIKGAGDVLKLQHSTCQKSKTYPSPSDVESTWTLLQEIHAEAQKKTHSAHCTSCSRASTLVIRSLVTLDASNYDRAVEVYTQTQRNWFSNPKVSIQPNFFTEWISWSAEFRKRK